MSIFLIQDTIKLNISKLTKEIDKHSSALKEIALTQTNDQKNIINIKNQLSDSF